MSVSPPIDDNGSSLPSTGFSTETTTVRSVRPLCDVDASCPTAKRQRTTASNDNAMSLLLPANRLPAPTSSLQRTTSTIPSAHERELLISHNEVDGDGNDNNNNNDDDDDGNEATWSEEDTCVDADVHNTPTASGASAQMIRGSARWLDDDDAAEYSDIPDDTSSEFDSDLEAADEETVLQVHGDNACKFAAEEREALERVIGRRLRIVDDDATASDEQLLQRIAQCAGADTLPPLTDEQRQIVLHRPQAGERVLANAFAGAAKTTLCRLLSYRFSGHWKPLYIVFNKEAEKAAKRTMPEHVECRTTHSTALAFVRHHTGWKGNGELDASPAVRDQAVARTLQAFFNDPSRADIDAEHHVLDADAKERDRREVAELARAEWQDMCTNESARWTYDAVLKYLVLQREASHQWLAEHFDVIMVDEAQDTQRVLMPWYDTLTAVPVYFVGDTHQSIYGFNGSRDAMQHVSRHPSTRQFALTRSFRFGDNLATLATRLLRRMCMLTERGVRIRGRTDHETRIVVGGVPPEEERMPVMYVARTNKGAIAKAFAAHHVGLSVRILGRAGENLREASGLIEAHEDVLPGGSGRDSTVNQRLDELNRRCRCAQGRSRPRTFSDGQPFSESDRRERDMLRILRQYGTQQMRSLSAALRRDKEAGDDADEPDVTLGTVHSTKGLEFERVAMLDDYYPLKLLRKGLLMFSRRMQELGSYSLTPEDERRIWATIEGSLPRETRLRLRALVRPAENENDLTLPQQLDEEVHLYYVAMTRPRSVLYLNDELSEFLRPNTGAR